MEKLLEWCGYPTAKKFKDICVRFDKIYERDRHTDTHDGIGRACIASRGKNYTESRTGNARKCDSDEVSIS